MIRVHHPGSGSVKNAPEPGFCNTNLIGNKVRLEAFHTITQCCGSGIRSFFDYWIRDPQKICPDLGFWIKAIEFWELSSKNFLGRKPSILCQLTYRISQKGLINDPRYVIILLSTS
jgi:hypothetical protein